MWDWVKQAMFDSAREVNNPIMWMGGKKTKWWNVDVKTEVRVNADANKVMVQY